MKKIVIYESYVMNVVFSTRDGWPRGWPHGVTSGILHTCARNIRSGYRLPRQMF